MTDEQVREEMYGLQRDLVQANQDYVQLTTSLNAAMTFFASTLALRCHEAAQAGQGQAA